MQIWTEIVLGLFAGTITAVILFGIVFGLSAGHFSNKPGIMRSGQHSFTEITLDVTYTGRATLIVYDVLGREVRTLLDDVVQSGTRTVLWNADGMASGIYFVRLQAGDGVMTKKVALVR